MANGIVVLELPQANSESRMKSSGGIVSLRSGDGDIVLAVIRSRTIGGDVSESYPLDQD